MSKSALNDATGLLADDDIEGARSICDALLLNEPPDAQTLRLSGLCAARSGELEKAVAFLKRATALRKDPRWLRDLALVHSARRDWAAALSAFESAFAAGLAGITGDLDYARALLRAGEFGRAREEYRRIVEYEKDSTSAWLGLARACVGLRVCEEAIAAARQCLSLNPESAAARFVLTDALAMLNRFSDALMVAEEIAGSDPDSVDALLRLVHAQWDAGRLADCLRTFEAIIQKGGGNRDLLDFRLSALLHDASHTPLSLIGAHRDWVDRFCERTAPPAQELFRNKDSSKPRLRVAYLTGEFGCLATFHFLYPILRDHDRDVVELLAYNSRRSPDGCTDVYRDLFSEWHDVSALPDEELVCLIRSHDIDILVDASGHYPFNRLTAFALRAAPVQVFYPNYPGTTGVPEMDYVLTDPWTCPPGSEGNYTERVYRLPTGYLTYQPPGPVDIPPLPALKNGYVTFGVFQRPSKLNGPVLDAIARCMSEVPESRLLLQFTSKDLVDQASRFRVDFEKEMKARGISETRLMFCGPVWLRQRVELLGEVDISLDTFPYNGQTTTCECLWMGVPVVTLAGATHVSRVACSLLHQVGLEDWVAASVDEYVAIAARWARDLPALASLRGGMRERLGNSLLLDNSRAAREIEKAFREMWTDWCAS